MIDKQHTMTHTHIVYPEPPFDFFKTVGFSMYHKRRYGGEFFKEGIYSRLLTLKDNIVLVQARSLGTVNKPAVRIDLAAPKLSEEMKIFCQCTMSRVLGGDRSVIPFYELALQDKSLAPIIRSFYGLRIPQAPNVFEALVTSILGQQISNQIAKLLRTRLVDTLGPSVEIAGENYVAFPRPQDVVDAGFETLRKLSLSTRKSEYLIDLSNRLLSDDLQLEKMQNLSNTDLIQALTSFRGIGPWTAQWMLVRAFGRCDGFPFGDLALQRFMGQLINQGIRLGPKEALAVSERWIPYRSYFTTYIFAAGRVDGLKQ